ncbi:hypothetical protein SKAU_G00106750 [Synaphobranchus kaupii]|uniref:Uncharacterized protein n=1 Tax=Synaphobranchus kaupii TaxID=118154 RepID=A0A9Q1FZV9_SYNKA|nr:hypothetical protein SKAU_G00106750 [Synaphobranchus kaupii]
MYNQVTADPALPEIHLFNKATGSPAELHINTRGWWAVQESASATYPSVTSLRGTWDWERKLVRGQHRTKQWGWGSDPTIPISICPGGHLLSLDKLQRTVAARVEPRAAAIPAVGGPGGFHLSATPRDS